MRCIFCKQESTTSKSVEHIIPESLGNREHILPPEVVCDKCNNYFSNKLEKPLLDSNHFVHARFEMDIPNKKGRTPCITGIHLESSTVVKITRDNGGAIFPVNEKDLNKFIDSVLKQETGHIVFLDPSTDTYTMSRFIGKVAIEVLAQKLNSLGRLNEIVDNQELDPLRKYARFGKPNFIWPFRERQNYHACQLFYEEGTGFYEVLHEFKFLDLEGDLYFALVLFGKEYVINMEKPEIDLTKLPCPAINPDREA